ncbi:O-antigen ligase-like membrane protein [Winogradskyella epiphytica]|uniref:O-antigen ligase-like membrane protein n=1 Tax=Winogradskyella epiphytica TaxID=262005 RepID=A0A2V4XUS0_9FLAO|nr:O-antigen ligase family protein [Winogradskyella epiphytica]PYE82121.1 O-antigen ligase-like membrane protein [Winogradskyella epiphytica]GGW60390.1 ligase [Winogradskyella epiphytica]
MKTNITYISAIGLHAVIGMFIYFNESLAKLYFFSALFYFLYRIIMISDDKKTYEVLKACAYFVGIEVFMRTTKGSVSYEASKYLVMLFVMIGMFYKGVSGRAYPYLFYLMFLIPSIFVASTTLSFDANFRTNIAFVLSGPACLGVAALFCYDKKVSPNQLHKVLLYMLLPLIAHMVYNFFYTPDLREVITNTASNTAASGGFGSNQVATVFGLGMFILAVRFFVKSPSIPLKILNISLFAMLSFRALVTLSRGGIYAAVIALIAFLVMYYGYVNYRRRSELIMLLGVFCFSIFAVWTYSSVQTNNMLDKRYANKDSLGREKEDISTGRVDLFVEEIEGFISSPFFGIGSSRAKDQRIEDSGQGVISHNEVSRTLAEHGVLGVAILIILIFKPLYYRSQNKNNIYFYAFLCLWFATINHSGMRIAMPAFIYALALLNVTNEKRPLHRKQLSR